LQQAAKPEAAVTAKIRVAFDAARFSCWREFPQTAAPRKRAKRQPQEKLAAILSVCQPEKHVRNGHSVAKMRP